MYDITEKGADVEVYILYCIVLYIQMQRGIEEISKPLCMYLYGKELSDQTAVNIYYAYVF